jgi:hypothetical protein
MKGALRRSGGGIAEPSRVCWLRAGKTRQLSLEAACWRREAVFTFLKGHHLTPIDTMTTTTYTLQSAEVQELTDEQLEQTNGGFLSFKVFALFHIAKTIVQCFRPRD